MTPPCSAGELSDSATVKLLLLSPVSQSTSSETGSNLSELDSVSNVRLNSDTSVVSCSIAVPPLFSVLVSTGFDASSQSVASHGDEKTDGATIIEQVTTEVSEFMISLKSQFKRLALRLLCSYISRRWSALWRMAKASCVA